MDDGAHSTPDLLGESPAAAGAPDHVGHRQRLRDRLLDGGGAAFLDHELLEYVLALAIPRRDTKPLAKRLERQFGSLAGALAAEPATLSAVDGMTPGAVAALLFVRETAVRMARRSVVGRPVLASWSSVIDYLRADMAHIIHERFRVLFLNSRNILIHDEAMSEGTVNHAPVYVRDIVKRALEVGATALILVHNHPSGNATPSRDDISMTREIIDACQKLSITVHDHIIIARDGETSFKTLGLI
jgi:DNA repair protein RadC